MRMKKNLIPITLLTGYLGAGKTTLLNYILNNQKGYKVAVIVNDIGEVNIDASLIAKEANIVLEDKDAIIPLQNGCICCNLKTDLIEQIIKLCESKKFDYILIEASGICEPIPIAQSIEALSANTDDKTMPAVCRLDNIVAVVDALRLVDEFASGNSLLKKDLEETDLEALIIQQIEFCNTILINKTDLVTPEQLTEVKKVVRALQPSAKLIETQKGVVDLKEILGTNAFDFAKVYYTAGWHKGLEEYDAHIHDAQKHEECEHHHDHSHCDHEHCCHNHEDGSRHGDEFGITTFVYYRRRPFERMKLEKFAANWPSSIIRAKGIIWFADNNDEGFIFEQAGKQIVASYAGDWLAVAPKRHIKKVMASDPEVVKNWDEKLGDRMVKIVFIGRDMDKSKTIAALDECTVEPKLK